MVVFYHNRFITTILTSLQDLRIINTVCTVANIKITRQLTIYIEPPKNINNNIKKRLQIKQGQVDLETKQL